ncbi:peroxin-10 [Microdochium nivale]|nr:peroxin-10 [Microdochium nivale]
MADASAPSPPSPPPAVSSTPAPSTSSSSSSLASMPTAPSTASSPYPYAFAPDIIRAHQKDAYFQGYLTNQISDLHRQLLGARSAHAWAAESHTAADLLYLCLTTLIGNRTLGEEYCGLVQVEAGSGGRLPALSSRATYIAGSILLPYALTRALPGIRKRIRNRLQRNISRLEDQQQQAATSGKSNNATPSSWSYKMQSYVLANLSTITSPASVHAVNLALFYFSGSYYEIAKRVAGLRYIFTHKVGESADRAGYEVLGVLLVIQMCVQGYLHVQTSIDSAAAAAAERSPQRLSAGTVNVSLDENQYSSNNSLLSMPGGGGDSSAAGLRINLAAATHTPILPDARYDLANEKRMRWIKGTQNRKCTLCLEELKDPAATGCGHVFCWPCIGDWVREKPECPLCRREALVQHILPLRAVGAAS